MQLLRYVLLVTLTLSLSPLDSPAQNTIPQPKLLSVFPPGGKAGSTLELEITEEVDLTVASGLIFSHKGITAAPIKPDADRFQPDPKPLRDRFKVTIASNVPPGTYEVRAKCRYGVSNARRFVVSNNVEMIEEEPNNDSETAIPIAIGSNVNGQFGADFDYYKLEAKKGQSLVVDCLAQRIDSGGDPVLTLLDARHQTIQRSQDSVGADATLVFKSDRDQTLFVRVNELTYLAGGPQKAAYRLAVREGPWIDFVDPPFAVRGKSNRLTVYGRNLNGATADVSQSIKGLEKIELNFTPPADTNLQANSLNELVIQPFQAAENLFGFRHSVAGKQSNAFPITLLDAPATDEVEPNDDFDSAQILSAETSILARFNTNGDIDRYRFTAKKDERFRIQVESHQIHAMNDPLLVVQTAKKQEDGSRKPRDLKVIDDENQTNNTFRFDWSSYDPALEFVAPEDGDYYILVQNQYGNRNGFPNYYRLSFGKPVADFRLVACAGLMIGQNNSRNLPVTPSSCVVCRGSGAEILLVARRSGGFNDVIHIQATGLPAGVTAEPVTVGPGENFASLVLRATEDAKAWNGPIKIVGKSIPADGKSNEVIREAHAIEIVRPAINNNQAQAPSRFGQEVFVTIVEDTPIVGRIETPELKLRMARGGRIELPLKFVKKGEFTGNISAFACGLPQLITRNSVNLPAAGTEAKMNIDVQQTCTPGSYSFFVRADLDTNFRRYPELAEEAKAEQTRMGNLFNELNKTYQEKTRQRSQSEQSQRTTTTKKTAADNLFKQRQRELAAIEPQLKQAQQNLKSATDNVNVARQQLDAANKKLASAGDEAAKKAAQAEVAAKQQAMQTAQTAMTTANTKLDQVTALHAGAKTNLDDAEMQMKVAGDAATKAVQDLEKARSDEAAAKQDRDTAQQKKTQADQWAQRTNQITQDRRVKSYAHSPSVTIEVVPYPIDLTLEKESYKVTAGQKLELNVLAKRDFNAIEEIRFQIQPPPGIGGWSLGQKQKIEKSGDKGLIELNIAATAKPGQYVAKLRGTYRFNNRNVSQEITLPITVDAPPK